MYSAYEICSPSIIYRIIGVFFNFSSHLIGVVSGLSTGTESSFSNIDDVYYGVHLATLDNVLAPIAPH